MKLSSITLALIIIAGLLVGTVIGGFGFSKTTEKIVYRDKIVNQNVSVPVFITKEVPTDYLDKALSEFTAKLEKDFDKYEELQKIEAKDKYTVEFDVKRDKEVITVTFDVDYKIIDTLINRRSSNSQTVQVVFREDKDPKVSIIA